MFLMYCNGRTNAFYFLSYTLPTLTFVFKGTLKNQGINFHENLKKIVKIKVYIFLFLGSPSIILARSDPLLYM